MDESQATDISSLPPGERTEWLLRHEHQLRVLARIEMRGRLAGKADPSDLVQQTLMEAWQAWHRMEAIDEAQRAAWLRRILANQLAKLFRHHRGTEKRDASREISIDAMIAQSVDRSAAKLDGLHTAQDVSPSRIVADKEDSERVAQVLETLPDDYREVILLRNFEELPYDQIAQRMGRSEPAVRMLWLRALSELGNRFKSEPNSLVVKPPAPERSRLDQPRSGGST